MVTSATSKNSVLPRFAESDPAAFRFFAEHGFVVLTDVLDEPDLNEIDLAWLEVVEEGAKTAGMDPNAFVVRFPQNRDLWRKNERFGSLLRNTRQAAVARTFLAVSGVRLFHDHAICKPAGRSGTIPWHQDSAYWPLDSVGGSLWTPTANCELDGGCLKVLDRSHLDGPGVPRDFLASADVDLDDDPRLVRIPVKRGETVVLSGLTWHGSDPNNSTIDRLAYLTLWVPATARFVPDHAAWHPTTAHIRVAAGERLDGEWFPLFGDVSEQDEGQCVEFPVPAPSSVASMFTAGRDIARHIAWLLGREQLAGQSAADLLAVAENRTACIDAALAQGLIGQIDRPRFAQLLDDIVQQEITRKKSVARDVYLRTVQGWWSLVGAQIQERVVGG